MTAPATDLRCPRTSSVVDAILDGRDVNGAHVASCAACARESERALRFMRNLAAATLDVSSGVPDPAVAAGTRRMGTRVGRLSLRLLTVGGAVAAGLLIAAVVSLRTQPAEPQPVAFGSVTRAEGQLAFLDLVCDEGGPGVVCESHAENHVHRVTLTTDPDGRVMAVDAVVESTDGKGLDKRGADVLFGRIARAVLSPEAGAAATAWIDDSLASCGSSCSVDLPQVSLVLEDAPKSISLTLREP